MKKNEKVNDRGGCDRTNNYSSVIDISRKWMHVKTQFGGEHNVEAISVCFKWGWEKFVQKMLN